MQVFILGSKVSPFAQALFSSSTLDKLAFLAIQYETYFIHKKQTELENFFSKAELLH